ncbi:MAG: hypothetical protein IV090_08190 [Candidatus Sericytochromatia bacterium]|nr:hypothetical protein [Candidatus Sericytochromatia bacterium]
MRLFSPFLTFGLALTLVASPGWAAEKDPFALMKSEQLGTLKLDLPLSQIKLPASCGSPQKDEETFWGADGALHQDWVYTACGLELGLVREKKTDPQHLFSLTLRAPSRLKTLRGIGIGSTAQAVLKAYASEYNPGESQKGLTIVAGTVYGGLIFTLKQGKVSEIFWGAAAE